MMGAMFKLQGDLIVSPGCGLFQVMPPVMGKVTDISLPRRAIVFVVLSPLDHIKEEASPFSPSPSPHLSTEQICIGVKSLEQREPGAGLVTGSVVSAPASHP